VLAGSPLVCNKTAGKKKGKTMKEFTPITMADLGFKDVEPVQLSPEHAAIVDAYSKVEYETMAIETTENMCNQETDEKERKYLKSQLGKHERLLKDAKGDLASLQGKD
jgi:hypothetical protein